MNVVEILVTPGIFDNVLKWLSIHDLDNFSKVCNLWRRFLSSPIQHSFFYDTLCEVLKSVNSLCHCTLDAGGKIRNLSWLQCQGIQTLVNSIRQRYNTQVCDPPLLGKPPRSTNVCWQQMLRASEEYCGSYSAYGKSGNCDVNFVSLHLCSEIVEMPAGQKKWVLKAEIAKVWHMMGDSAVIHVIQGYWSVRKMIYRPSKKAKLASTAPFIPNTETYVAIHPRFSSILESTSFYFKPLKQSIKDCGNVTEAQFVDLHTDTHSLIRVPIKKRGKIVVCGVTNKEMSFFDSKQDWVFKVQTNF